MRTSTAVAHANFALVKYWGKRSTSLNLPAVPSLSLTVDGYRTRTTVSWGAPTDQVRIDGRAAPPGQAQRVLRFLDLLDEARPPCAVESKSTFPAGAGLASSASAFAALAVAGAAAADQAELDRVRLSALARRGSGSACRSLWGGFVEWQLGKAADGADSHGVPVADAEHFPVRLVVGEVSGAQKPVGSTEAMEMSRRTSPYYASWVTTAPADVEQARRAIHGRDLASLGQVMEASTFKMHATTQTCQPPLVYWHPATVACLHAVFELRAQGTGAWATMDAGPNVKVLCAPEDTDRVSEALAPHVGRVTVLGPGPGAYLERT